MHRVLASGDAVTTSSEGLTIKGDQSNGLKILIVSTPKTGNTWLKSLLAVAYDLPVVEFPLPEFWRDFDAKQFDRLGPKWVAHQHLLPYDALVNWIRQRNVVLVTTIRHPGD